MSPDVSICHPTSEMKMIFFNPPQGGDITFTECKVHAGLLYACERCPVCVAIEERDAALGRAEYDKTQLEGRIDDLEQQVDAYRSELKL